MSGMPTSTEGPTRASTSPPPSPSTTWPGAPTSSPSRWSGRWPPTTTQRQEFPWPVLEEAAARGFYSPLFYRDLIGDPTGLSLPMFMEELFWGCAGIGLADRDARAGAVGDRAGGIARTDAASGRRNASARPAISSSPRWRSPNPRAAATCATCAPPRAGGDGRRLDHRRPQDVDRQRRHRQRARRQRRRRRGTRPPRAGAVHRARRHARPARWCASSTSWAAARRTPPS